MCIFIKIRISMNKALLIVELLRSPYFNTPACRTMPCMSVIAPRSLRVSITHEQYICRLEIWHFPELAFAVTLIVFVRHTCLVLGIKKMKFGWCSHSSTENKLRWHNRKTFAQIQRLRPLIFHFLSNYATVVHSIKLQSHFDISISAVWQPHHRARLYFCNKTPPSMRIDFWRLWYCKKLSIFGNHITFGKVVW